MYKNYGWFLKADLRKYEGKYIAISEKKVISSGPKPSQVYNTAKRKNPKNVPLLLGRTDVFDRFKILFDEKQKVLFLRHSYLN